MAANRRKHPRVRARGVAANVRAQEVLKTGCVVENISAGGLLVRTDQTLEAGTPVVMDLVRPGMRKLLKLSGRVVGRVERAANSPATVPGLRIEFDPMPDETGERLLQLLRDLGLSPEEQAAPPAPAPAPPAPAPEPFLTAAPVTTPVTTPSAPFGPPFLPAEMQQITWAPLEGPPEPSPEVSRELPWEASPEVPPEPPPEPPPEGLVETRAMSMEAVRTALEAAELTPPGGKVPSEAAQAALAPPPILPVPSAAPSQPSPKGEGEAPADSRLMVQIRGLLMELGEVQDRLDVKERESEDLRSEAERLRRENQELRQKLQRAEELLRSHGVKDPYDRF